MADHEQPDSSTHNASSNASGSNPSASLGRRLAAMLYDGFLVVAIWFLLGFLLQIIFGSTGNEMVDGEVQTDPLRSAILFFLMMLSAWGFYAWFWTRSGQTLGMIAWRIRAESRQGGLLSGRQTIQRWLLAWPAMFVFGLGYLWLLVDANGDALHDRLSGTRVVLLPKSHRPFQ